MVDISIEVFVLDSSQPSIIWVWECKKLSRPVSVDEVEEFHAKLQQIGADRTKGTVISAGAFQKSAITYAESKGIGLARWDSSQIGWVMHHPSTTQGSPSTIQALLDHEAHGTGRTVLLDPDIGAFDGTLEQYLMITLRNLFGPGRS